MTNELLKIYERDLDRLIQEIVAFRHEDNLWKTIGNVINPAGNLCLHLVGNLNTYIGKNIGNYPYIRNRDAEFSLKNISKDKLIAQVEETKEIVLATIRQLDTKRLEENHPEDVLGYTMTNLFFLIHLAAHLSYHLGQINYVRRVLE